MVGYRRADGSPIALLARRDGMRLVEPSGDGRTVERRVTEAVAGTLEAFADVLAPSLGDRPVGGRALLRAGLAGSRRDLGVLAAAGLVGGVLALAIPVAVGLLVAELLPAEDRAGIVLLGLALVVTALSVAIATLIRDLAVLRIETRLDASVGAAVWDRLLRLPAGFFRDFAAGDLARRALGVESARQALTGTAASAVLGFAFSVPSLLFLAWLSLPFAALIALTMAAVLAAFLLIGRAELRASRRFNDQAGRLAAITTALISGLPALHVAGAEGRAYRVWEREFTRQQASADDALRAGTWLATTAAAASRLTLAVLFLVAAARIAEVTAPGAFLAFYAAFGQVLAATVAVGSAISTTARMLPAIERARPILEAVPEDAPAGISAGGPEPRRDPGVLEGAIALDDVTFAYAESARPIVDRVSFSVPVGGFVAIVGASGAGKSTLLRLLLGFERPSAGRVSYDGQPLDELDPFAVRRQLGVVLQDASLMAGDIRGNILGTSGLGEEDAWEAARLVGLADEIRRMPMGMQTFVAEGGGALSAGQRQRILLARAVVRRPRILLLDEATSALDAATQRTVTQGLAGLSVTRLVIAHRLSTVVDAERILVLEAGRIVESGTASELLAMGGRFAELGRRQLV
jgi:ATP-binding cassette subfamily C protein